MARRRSEGRAGGTAASAGPGTRRRILLAAVLLLALGLGLDLSRPPAAQVSTRALLGAIEFYQATLSGRVGLHCRFRPTCSLYGETVIRREGALVGGLKTAWRILRCGPWTPAGTFDPPPGG